MSNKVIYIAGGKFLESQKDGGLYMSYMIYKMLKELYGEKLYTAAVFEDGQKNTQYYREFCADSSRFNRLFCALNGRYELSKKTELDIIKWIGMIKPRVLVIVSVYGTIVKKIKQMYPDIKIVVVMHNIESHYYKKRAQMETWHLWPVYFGIKKNEMWSINFCDYIVTLNQRDSDMLLKLYGREADYILPIFLEDKLKVSRNETCNRKELLFVGSLFQPNFDGIKWFVDEVMSKLKDYQLTIVGKNFETVSEQLIADNVDVIGTVEDLEYYYQNWPIIVSPIFYGSGMKVKTAEAMMYGKIIIASDEALEGYNIDGVLDIYRCNTPNEFIEAIEKVFIQKKVKLFSENVRKIYEKNYSYNAVKEKFGEFILRI